MLLNLALNFTDTLQLILNPLRDSPSFWPRLIGMTITSALLGFVIGGVLGIILMSVFRRFNSEKFPVKHAILAGGLLGALGCSVVFVYLVL